MMPVRILPLALLLGACAIGQLPITMTGGETRSESDAPRVVPARITPAGDDADFEMVAADGIVFTGHLLRQQANAPALLGPPLELVGQASGGGIVLECRFMLLNGVRGAAGGGTGRCQGSDRRVDFVF